MNNTYVLADVHGHSKTLKRLLSKISPSSDDIFYVLGDMIDRGPDPVGVIRLCRELPNANVIIGNHEDLMLKHWNTHNRLCGEYGWKRDDVASIGATFSLLQRRGLGWRIEDALPTLAGFSSLVAEERLSILSWIGELPLYAYCRIESRLYILVHAGIRRPQDSFTKTVMSDRDLDRLLESQRDQDLLNIRSAFWYQPTGLVNSEGEGPIVIAGHTATCSIGVLRKGFIAARALRPSRTSVDGKGRCQMVAFGGTRRTGHIPDKIAIDCGAAGGPPKGQVLILRLNDMHEFYEPVLDDE